MGGGVSQTFVMVRGSCHIKIKLLFWLGRDIKLWSPKAHITKIGFTNIPGEGYSHFHSDWVDWGWTRSRARVKPRSWARLEQHSQGEVCIKRFLGFWHLSQFNQYTIQT